MVPTHPPSRGHSTVGFSQQTVSQQETPTKPNMNSEGNYVHYTQKATTTAKKTTKKNLPSKTEMKTNLKQNCYGKQLIHNNKLK